jgi:hypothetical protein
MNAAHRPGPPAGAKYLRVSLTANVLWLANDEAETIKAHA